MNNIVKQMLNQYDLKSVVNIKYPLAEIIQKIILACLSKIDFFNEVAFCGGTSLRIFHNLNRFSEDLDFNLIKSNKSFKLSKYNERLLEMLQSFGLDFTIMKNNEEVNVQKETLVANLYELVKKFSDNKFLASIRPNQTLKIKLEVDTNPPKTLSNDVEDVLLYEPFFCKVKILKIETLFAGKINAILTRGTNSTYPKGRDYYDYLFYMSRHISPDLSYLQYSLSQYKMWNKNKTLKIDDLKELLNTNFSTLNVEFARKDVSPLIKSQEELDFWSNEAFILTLKDLK